MTISVDAAASGSLGAAGAGVNLAVGAAIGVATLAGARVPASLRCIEIPHIGFVPFDFNPNTIKVTRRGQSETIPEPVRPDALPAGGANTSAGSTSYMQTAQPSDIALENVVFEGPTTKLRCDTLLTWMSPSAGFFAQIAALGQNFATAPPKLTFQWGPPMIGFMYDVRIKSCSINYDRFTAAGIPIRARVSLTMIEIPSLLGTLPTNPTSGGLPGRRGHTVAEGESLQSIAVTHYGRPGLWRRIAEVNGIQDPARLRPGTQIYLPNPDELTSGARR